MYWQLGAWFRIRKWRRKLIERVMVGINFSMLGPCGEGVRLLKQRKGPANLRTTLSAFHSKHGSLKGSRQKFQPHLAHMRGVIFAEKLPVLTFCFDSQVICQEIMAEVLHDHMTTKAIFPGPLSDNRKHANDLYFWRLIPCYVCLKWCQVIDVCVTVCVDLMSCGF